MDNFDFIFNGDKLFDFKNVEKKAMDNLKQQEEKSLNLNTVMGDFKQSQNEIEFLKREMHVKNKIILDMLKENEAYRELVQSLLEEAEPNPDEQEHVKEIQKVLNDRGKMNNILKMAIEMEEAFDI